MKVVKLLFNAQFVGKIEETVEVADNANDDYIKSLFPKYIGCEFDDNCSYELLNKGDDRNEQSI